MEIQTTTLTNLHIHTQRSYKPPKAINSTRVCSLDSGQNVIYFVFFILCHSFAEPFEWKRKNTIDMVVCESNERVIWSQTHTNRITANHFGRISGIGHELRIIVCLCMCVFPASFTCCQQIHFASCSSLRFAAFCPYRSVYVRKIAATKSAIIGMSASLQIQHYNALPCLSWPLTKKNRIVFISFHWKWFSCLFCVCVCLLLCFRCWLLLLLNFVVEISFINVVSFSKAFG